MSTKFLSSFHCLSRHFLLLIHDEIPSVYMYTLTLVVLPDPLDF